MSTVGSGIRLQSGAFYKSQGKKMLELLTYTYKTHYEPVRVWTG
jgi:hypothetical protein